MNARVPEEALSAEAPLMAAYVYDDTLNIDLYGELDAEGAHQVRTIKVTGTDHNITTLFSARQLENLGNYLDVKNSDSETLRNWAFRYQCAAQHH